MTFSSTQTNHAIIDWQLKQEITLAVSVGLNSPNTCRPSIARASYFFCSYMRKY